MKLVISLLFFFLSFLNIFSQIPIIIKKKTTITLLNNFDVSVITSYNLPPNINFEIASDGINSQTKIRDVIVKIGEDVIDKSFYKQKKLNHKKIHPQYIHLNRFEITNYKGPLVIEYTGSLLRKRDDSEIPQIDIGLVSIRPISNVKIEIEPEIHLISKNKSFYPSIFLSPKKYFKNIKYSSDSSSVRLNSLIKPFSPKRKSKKRIAQVFLFEDFNFLHWKKNLIVKGIFDINIVSLDRIKEEQIIIVKGEKYYSYLSLINPYSKSKKMIGEVSITVNSAGNIYSSIPMQISEFDKLSFENPLRYNSYYMIIPMPDCNEIHLNVPLKDSSSTEIKFTFDYFADSLISTEDNFYYSFNYGDLYYPELPMGNKLYFNIHLPDEFEFEISKKEETFLSGSNSLSMVLNTQNKILNPKTFNFQRKDVKLLLQMRTGVFVIGLVFLILILVFQKWQLELYRDFINILISIVVFLITFIPGFVNKNLFWDSIKFTYSWILPLILVIYWIYILRKKNIHLRNEKP